MALTAHPDEVEQLRRLACTFPENKRRAFVRRLAEGFGFTVVDHEDELDLALHVLDHRRQREGKS